MQASESMRGGPWCQNLCKEPFVNTRGAGRLRINEDQVLAQAPGKSSWGKALLRQKPEARVYGFG